MNTDIKVKLDRFFSQYKLYKLKKGDILIKAEETPFGVFYLTQGVVKMYAISEKGEELILNLYRPVSFFPMSHAINNTPISHYYEAMTPIEAWKAPKKEVVEFLKSEPEVLFDLLSRVYIGLEGFFSRMQHLMTGSAEAKVITELIIAAKRFGINNNQTTTISLKLTEKDLAAQTGIARETVSRIIHDLKDKDLIIFNRSALVVKDLKKLEAEIFLN